MGYKIFADTNIFLDVILQRGADWQHAEAILLLAEDRKIELFTSASSLLNIMYALRRYKLSAKEINDTAINILSFTKLINPDDMVFAIALHSDFKDKEDAVQYYTALKEENIKYFVTSNLKDFKHAMFSLKIISPSQLSSILSNLQL